MKILVVSGESNSLVSQFFFIIIITCLIIDLNNIFILKNKSRKILFDNENFILYFLILVIKNMMFLDYMF